MTVARDKENWKVKLPDGRVVDIATLGSTADQMIVAFRWLRMLEERIAKLEKAKP